MPAFNIPYSDYLKYIVPGQTYTDESGNVIPNMAPTMDEERWNALDNTQKYQMLYGYGNPNGQRGTPNFDPSGRDEDAQAFQSQFGDPAWKDDQSGRSAGEFGRRYIWGYGDLPEAYGAPASEYMIDPTRVWRDADGRWVIESDNVKGDWLATQQHRASSTFDRRVWQSALALAAAAAGGMYLGAAEGAGGAAGGAMDMGVGLDEVATGMGSQGLGQPALNATVGTAVTPAAASTPAAVTPGAVPVTDLSVPAAGTGTGSTGFIDGARQAVSGAWDWYNGLSPASRFIVNQGVSMGVQGLMGANAQRTASDAADAAQRQAEEDRIRRSRVPVFGPAAYTPKSGLINSKRG